MMRRMRRALRPNVEGMESRELLSVAGATIAAGLYHEVLLREPDPQGLAAFTRFLDMGGTVRQAASRLYDSVEFRADETSAYYDQMLGRDPSAAEAQWCSRVLVQPSGPERTVGAIAGSTEYYAKAGGDAASFVRALYVDVLGRHSDPGGLSFYVSQIQTGVGRGAVASEFTASPEYRATKVREAYQAVLGRSASDAEAAGWAAGWGRLGGLRGVSLAILGSPENHVRLRTGGATLPDMTAVAQLRQILHAQYTEQADGFVNLYNSLLGTHPAYDTNGDAVTSPPTNTALWNLMRTGGATDGRPRDEAQVVTPMTVNVGALTPLQSEVDIDKSLGFLLGKDPAKSDLAEYLAGGVIQPFGGPILTGGGGQYIVDGHHRWSSLFVINPDAQIEAVDIGYEKAPQDYLKVTQMAVGADLGFLQVQSVEGQNLFTISRPDFDAWVAATIANGQNPAAVLAVFQQARGLVGIQAVSDFLWGNVERMRQNNQPAPGVTSRDYMPQPPSGGIDALLPWLTSGVLNDRAPIVARLG